ncbi:hypothetical protein EIP91_006034 [Steccherinum ochraceum]|uniref:Uncharacterized protein n=1 Tax=Steccherinum ochraceum TaxID=92696 RepID=A0A4R0RH64_9APHY|nr:hypothetical protein EIP91_006034 [Steccherinum ochraceum]
MSTSLQDPTAQEITVMRCLDAESGNGDQAASENIREIDHRSSGDTEGNPHPRPIAQNYGGTLTCQTFSSCAEYRRPELPVEIWEKVIDMVRDGTSLFISHLGLLDLNDRALVGSTKRDLHSLSLVCRSWVDRSRFHLLEVITIRSGSELLALTRERGPLSSGARVKKLTIDVEGGRDQSWVTLIPSRLSPSVLGQIKVLSLKHVDLVKSHHRIVQSFSLFRPVPELILDHIRCRHFSQLLEFARALQTGIVNISFPHTQSLDAMHFSTRRFLLSRVGRLYVALPWTSVHHFVKLCIWPCFSMLGHVDIRLDAAYSVDSPHLQQSKGIWECLSTLYQGMCLHHPAPMNAMMMIRFTNLTVFMQQNGFNLFRDHRPSLILLFFYSNINAVPSVLQFLSRHNFQTVNVGIDGKVGDPDPMTSAIPKDWQAVDTVLCSSAFSALRKVGLDCTGRNERLPSGYSCVAELYPIILPKCTARGVAGPCAMSCPYHRASLGRPWSSPGYDFIRPVYA